MKLKYVMQAGVMTAVRPATYDQWVTLKLTNMTLWREQRAYDSQTKIQIFGTHVIDDTMLVNNMLLK